MNNVVDRVPTEVLANGAVRWEQFDSQGNSLGYVYLKKADEPSVEGTPLNKELFDSIKTDLDSRLLSSSKATQAEAEAGSNNTRYMTPLRVKQYHDKNVGVKITKLNLSTSTSTDIDLSTYLTSNVEKLEIIINCRFTSTSTGMLLSGTGMRNNKGGKYVNSVTSPVTIGGVSTVDNVRGILEIYPEIYTYNFFGNIANDYVTEFGGFDTLQTLTLGKRDIDSRNYDYQVAIYQYLK